MSGIATDGVIILKIPVVKADAKWNDVHTKITELITGNNADVFVNNDGTTWDQQDIDKFKEQVRPAAAAYKGGEKFEKDVKAANNALQTALTNTSSNDDKLKAHENYGAALKTASDDAKSTLFSGGRSKGRSKKGGSKRRGSKKRRSSKSKSKGRKH